LTNLRLILRLAEFFKSQQHSCTCVCSVIHKGAFLYENIDTNKMYVCIFNHSFLKWTVGDKITNRLFTGPVTVSHKCKTRKPCCRKETARCCKCSFRSKFANNIPYKYKTIAMLRKPRFRAPNMLAQNTI